MFYVYSIIPLALLFPWSFFGIATALKAFMANTASTKIRTYESTLPLYQ